MRALVENIKKTHIHLLGTVSDDRVPYTDLCSQTAKLELLCKERSRLRKARSDVTLVGNRTPEEVSRQMNVVVHTYTTRPSSTKPSTSRGSSRPERSFLRSILVAQSKIAMSMNNELFATWRPTHNLRPKPYVA
jgi:hypothetical protein